MGEVMQAIKFSRYLSKFGYHDGEAWFFGFDVNGNPLHSKDKRYACLYLDVNKVTRVMLFSSVTDAIADDLKEY